MSTGGLENSQQQTARGVPPPTDELQEALGRLRSRIEEVSAWARHASLPGAVSGEGDCASGEGDGSSGEGDGASGEGDGAPGVIAKTESTASRPTLAHVRDLSRSGAIAGGVFREGRDIIDLGTPDGAGQAPIAGLVALLDLVPTDTILEVRTTDADLRAAHIGEEVFAFKLVPGREGEVDQWLASLLPLGET